MQVYDPKADVVTWYIDHEHTHNVSGLAHVSTGDRGWPDMVFEGLTVKQCAAVLRALGFEQIETNVLDLELAWHEGCPKDGISWHGSRGECQYCGAAVAPTEEI